LRQPRLSLAAQGRSLMLLHGRREGNHWWKAPRWVRLKRELAGWLVERLQVLRTLILAVNQAVRQLSSELEAAAPAVRPQGMGRVTHQTVQTEVAD
jgi:hypothetical protein